MRWDEYLKDRLAPYGPVVEDERGLLFEMVDEESGTEDRLAFVVPDPGSQGILVEASVAAIADLTDHDLPDRNVFAFGFEPEFEGTVIKLGLFDVEPGTGAAIGAVPMRVLEIAEKNRIPFRRADGEGIGLPLGGTKEDFEALVKLIEAIAFEW